ncbi:Nuclear transcription factor Y subunit gamma [Trichinella sp. T6]|nr:Nuclear transcription factor Y subunit gamma [Trichinella sp. T6]
MDFSQSDTKQKLEEFWKLQLDRISKMDAASVRNPRLLDLPIARVKKIMKLDEEVKPLMISAEAPVLLAKAAQMFIENLTLRAWGHTEENKRKTLQKNDIAMAISKDDQFDFLIDTVPREHAPKAPASSVSGQCGPIIVGTGGNLEAPVESLQYFIQLGSVPLQEGSGAQQLNESQLLQLPNGQVYSAITVPPHLITGNTPMQILSPMNCNNGQEQPMLQQFLAVDSSTGQLQAIQVDQNQMEAGNSNNSVVGSSLSQINAMPTTLILQSSDGQPYHELQITNLEQTDGDNASGMRPNIDCLSGRWSLITVINTVPPPLHHRKSSSWRSYCQHPAFDLSSHVLPCSDITNMSHYHQLSSAEFCCSIHFKPTLKQE